MTSLAFIFGVMPLVWAIGAGAELRQTLGTAVFSGMIGVTVFGLIFTPAFYVICRWIAARDEPACAPAAARPGGVAGGRPRWHAFGRDAHRWDNFSEGRIDPCRSVARGRPSAPAACEQPSDVVEHLRRRPRQVVDAAMQPLRADRAHVEAERLRFREELRIVVHGDERIL